MTQAFNQEATIMTELTNNQHSARFKNMALWALQILTAAAFLMAGFAKLSGQPTMVETFDKVGIGQWFR
jgi:putative oxidoreductase